MLTLTLLRLSLSLLTAGGHSSEAKATKTASAWYSGFHAQDFPISEVNWSKYTQMTYAFAETTPDVNVLSLENSNETVLLQFVAAAKKNGVKASLSIGGWTGSLYYSSNVASAKNRTAFVKAVIGLATKYDLDGIDFDWEYPGVQGIGCNVISPQDTSNFLLFLQELRCDPLGSKLTLSAATSITPFADAKGDPSADVSHFSKVLDYIAVMNYDIWGPWSDTVGPNAPLDDSCAPDYAQGSATSAVQAWTAAGMPAHQIVLGVPSYGYAFYVTLKNAFTPGSNSSLAGYPPFDKTKQPSGDKWDDQPGVDECGNQAGVGGIWNYWGLIEYGFLDEAGNVKGGIVGKFDNCSQTAYLYNPQTQVMISYDDCQSFTAKGRFIKHHDLGGYAMWEAGGDSNDMLVTAIRNSAGF